MTGRKRICLDLFSGLGGFSQAFQDADGWEVVAVDLDPERRFYPDIRADVMDLRPSDLPDADVVLASPPCEKFSIAARNPAHFDTGEPQTADARAAVLLVYHSLGLIKALNPEHWYLENPQGHLRQVIGPPTGTVTYCQYGADQRKATDLWGDHPPMEYRWCARGDDCHWANDTGGVSSRPSTYSADPAERAMVPRNLSEQILEAVEGRHEQQTLVHAADGGTSGVESTGSEREGER